MSETTIHNAKMNLSRLIRQALAGEEVIIAKAGKPVVRLVPVEVPHKTPRFGGWEGEFYMAEDFDAELSDFDDYMPVDASCTGPYRKPVDR